MKTDNNEKMETVIDPSMPLSSEGIHALAESICNKVSFDHGYADYKALHNNLKYFPIKWMYEAFELIYLKGVSHGSRDLERIKSVSFDQGLKILELQREIDRLNTNTLN